MTEEMSMIQKIWNTAAEFFVNYSFQVLGAIIVLIVGFAFASWVERIVLNLCKKKNLDITLSKFFASMVKLTVLGFAVIVALSKFGITIAPFIAAIGAAAFGASFAIQGPLSNYGAGLSIILTRPFVVGNTISVTGVHGVVKEVKLGCTILADENGTIITIPNKHIVGEIVYNSQENKVVEGSVGIGYDSDSEKAVQIIKKVISQNDEVVKNPAFEVGIQGFGDSAIHVAYRYWVPTLKRFHVLAEINQNILSALQEQQIVIPYPQREVRLISEVNKA